MHTVTTARKTLTGEIAVARFLQKIDKDLKKGLEGIDNKDENIGVYYDVYSWAGNIRVTGAISSIADVTAVLNSLIPEVPAIKATDRIRFAGNHPDKSCEILYDEWQISPYEMDGRIYTEYTYRASDTSPIKGKRGTYRSLVVSVKHCAVPGYLVAARETIKNAKHRTETEREARVTNAMTLEVQQVAVLVGPKSLSTCE